MLGRTLILVVGGLAALASDLRAQHPETLVRGRPVEVREATGASRSGELIAVGSDSLWLATGDGARLEAFSLDGLRRVRIRQHSLGTTGLLWTLGGTVVTGGLLTVACASVSDGCGAVFAGVALAWGLVGGLSTASMASGSSLGLDPRSDALRAYARFPQGLEALPDVRGLLADTASGGTPPP